MFKLSEMIFVKEMTPQLADKLAVSINTNVVKFISRHNQISKNKNYHQVHFIGKDGVDYIYRYVIDLADDKQLSSQLYRFK